MKVSPITILALASIVTAIACDSDELAQYDFQSLKGVHKISVEKDTPPSKTEITWNIGICEPVKDVENCPKDSVLCGVTTVKLDKTTFVSQIVSVGPKDTATYKSIKNAGKHNDENGIIISYDNVKWGDSEVDAELKFLCPNDKHTEDTEPTLEKWDGSLLRMKMVTKAACISDKAKTPKKPSEPEDNGESWGWFTWIFIFFVLFLSVYIIGGAWFQYNRGNSIDFQTALYEVLENFLDVLRGLPNFIREIIERFTGNANRGEYSAV